MTPETWLLTGFVCLLAAGATPFAAVRLYRASKWLNEGSDGTEIAATGGTIVTMISLIAFGIISISNGMPKAPAASKPAETSRQDHAWVVNMIERLDRSCSEREWLVGDIKRTHLPTLNKRIDELEQAVLSHSVSIGALRAMVEHRNDLGRKAVEAPPPTDWAAEREKFEEKMKFYETYLKIMRNKP